MCGDPAISPHDPHIMWQLRSYSIARLAAGLGPYYVVVADIDLLSLEQIGRFIESKINVADVPSYVSKHHGCHIRSLITPEVGGRRDARGGVPASPALFSCFSALARRQNAAVLHGRRHQPKGSW